MEDIRKIIDNVSTPDITGLFTGTNYLVSNGKKNPMYYMNRDGFTLLVMAYSGEKAMKFKLGYIKQFNAMENMVSGLVACGWDYDKVKSFIEQNNTKYIAC